MCICDTLEPRYNKHAYNEFPRYNESKIWPLVYFSHVIDHPYNEFLVITKGIWRSPENSLYRGSSVSFNRGSEFYLSMPEGSIVSPMRSSRIRRFSKVF